MVNEKQTSAVETNMSMVSINKTAIQMNISLICIDNLEESAMSFSIKILAELKWYDSRLSFYNLKSDSTRVNSISAKVSYVNKTMDHQMGS